MYDKSINKKQAESLLNQKGAGWLSSREVGGSKFRPPTSDKLLLALPAELLMVTKKGQFKLVMKTCAFKVNDLVQVFYTKLCSNESKKHVYKAHKLAVLKCLAEKNGGSELLYALFFGRLALLSEWICKAVTFATLYEGSSESSVGLFLFSSSDISVLDRLLISLMKCSKVDVKLKH